MIKIGMLVGDRYEILEKIGTGGMSDVYKAKDHKLNRHVAVKILKQEFSENANFVAKFRVEAQAAAGLMHPNIVNVYDVGEEDGIYYIVMELVEGITLKKYIEKKARLSFKEAVSIALQVCMGIEAAHNNHIIHRDIKPQNIIISKEGKVKVTDFGIAKAATSNTITSNVMGSVHYTSPEQARGGYSDEKSDIYSMGITLFEMLTGRVPFNGDTTVAIAIKHIQEPMPSPREYVSEIPVSVERIVFKCTQKSPDRRYQNMRELIVDLKKSLMNPDEDFVKVIDPDEEAATRAVTDREMTQIKKQSRRKEEEEEYLRLNKKSHRTTEEARAAGTKTAQPKKKKPVVEEFYEEEEDDDDYDTKMEKITTILAIVAAVLIGCVVIFLVGRAVGVFDFGNPGTQEEQEASKPVTMPDLSGKTWEQAQETLAALGLVASVQYEESEEIQQGFVISANVAAGAELTVGSTVLVTVSSGMEGVVVPDVAGKAVDEAVATLEKSGFSVKKEEVAKEDVKRGTVIEQTPEGGSKAPRGSEVSIRVSAGVTQEQMVTVPNVMGQTEMDATVLLAEAGLLAGNVREVDYEDASYAGKVCRQSHSAGSSVAEGTKIDLDIAKGVADITYYFRSDIDGPDVEDPSWAQGTEVEIILMTNTDPAQELYRTTTASFPCTINVSGIRNAESGLLTLTYTANVEGSITTDAATGETIVTEERQEPRSIQREVVFTREG